MPRPLIIAKAGLLACLWGSVTAATVCSYSQEPQSPPSSDQKPVFTLKVYTGLVQVPTLVLDNSRRPVPQIDFQRFRVTLDGGKQFAPTHVRMEGQDPLNLAIVIDVGPQQSRDLIAGLADATAEMARKQLNFRDRVSIYVLSCNLLRTAQAVEPSPALLSNSIEAGLQLPQVGKNTAGASCGTDVYLWSALTAVIKDIAGGKGRCAILVVSNGHDDGSKVPWPRLHEYAGVEGVALFGLREATDVQSQWQRDHIDVFRALCESTGGVVMTGGRRDVQKRLQQWVEMLRGRYIVEFPRPQALTSGEHDIVVSVKKGWWAFTTVAGVSVSMPDPALTADPNYIPSNEGSNIPVGKRRPLPH